MPIKHGYRYAKRSEKLVPYSHIVWSAANGPPPKDCVIHHKDRNPLNNDLSNLQCMTTAEHRAHHIAVRRLKPQIFICAWCRVSVVRESYSNKKMLFCSQKCNYAAWRASHPKDKKLGATYHRTCPHCQDSYDTIYPTKIYCSQRCHTNAASKRKRPPNY
jgi:endogenous inhibitor of DNA gyrase (YacG/DUF329 family)